MENTKDIVFPAEKTELAMSEIIKKYGLGEDATPSIAFVVKKIAIDEMDINGAVEKLKNDLNIPLEKAQQVANELKDKVVPLGKERAEFKKENDEKVENEKESPPLKEKIANPYRESIE